MELKLSNHLFWDVNKESIDWNKHVRWVVERVVSYGDLKIGMRLKTIMAYPKLKKRRFKLEV